LDEFDAAISLLSMFPLAGRERADVAPNLRSYGVHPYQIFYRVFSSLKRLEIARVLPARSDIGSADFS
jgi:plasmid stabilization system protein ParE